jgi:hypothetical protein
LRLFIDGAPGFLVRRFGRPDEAPGAKQKSANIAQQSRPRAFADLRFTR